ncbi:hypothetical protein ACOMICROBIO_LKFPLAJE_01404 [Vibrio sp. B1FIG11]|uniref:hypothetical protein n=1 Tax=Vibrio TaxID=662 RepID=UPI001AF873AC|nr:MULTISPECIES: hypothetical protein [Vibrio]UMM01792.1 hypothetical protein MKR81_09370 [Vibrio campbellii]CAE6900700.1 hypothetical protein ACOMICROBIO_LKFPLAJE_01404 [Vibrio sp. B1FIG11]
MKYIRIIGCAIAVMLLSGCVSQKAMDIPSDFWQTGGEKISLLRLFSHQKCMRIVQAVKVYWTWLSTKW